MLEKSIEKYLREQIELYCGRCRKWRSPQNNGVLDRIVQVFGKVYFVELKKEDGSLSKLQELEIKWLKDNGYNYEVIASKKEVDNFILRVLGEALVKNDDK
jgi:hypothetical protein